MVIASGGEFIIRYNKIKVLLIDDNQQLCESVARYLKDTGKFQIAGMAHDASNGILMLRNSRPDVAVVDLVLPMGDGISILEHIRDNPSVKKTAVVVLSAIVDEYKTRQVMELGAHYYLLKPFSLSVLARRVEEAHMHTAKSPSIRDSLIDEGACEKYASSLLLNLGVPAHLRGFLYLKRAIVAEVYPPRIEGLTKGLYPSLAKEFQTTPVSVERAIRHAIEVAWQKGMCNAYYQLLGCSPVQEKKPSNGAFISSMAELLRNSFNEDFQPILYQV